METSGKTSPEPSAAGESEAAARLRRAGRWLGPLAAVFVYAALPDSYGNAAGQTVAFGHLGRVTAALAAWMGLWWITEAIPVYATALLPLAILPLTGAATMSQSAAPYGHELIYLFLGGFVLALSMERWGLHRRIALVALRFVGTQPSHVVGGFMGVTALLSMWVSNTATAVLMTPIAISVMALVQGTGGATGARGRLSEGTADRLGLALFLGIAYSASIGGLGTLIGTPPNLFLASFVQRELGIEIGFARWMAFGVPLVLVFLPIAWWRLTRELRRGSTERIEGGDRLVASELARLGRMSRGEWTSFVVFSCTAVTWVLRPLLQQIPVGDARPLSGLTDTGIAILAALALFLTPVNLRKGEFAMDWETAVRLPWGVLILFGGGLSLADAMERNGVGLLLASLASGFADVPPIATVVAVTAGMVFLTELTSNTATAAALVPVLAAVAPSLGLDPMALALPAAIGASCAFMLPAATPPNAVVFGSGCVTLRQMARAGLWLNLVGIVLIVAATYAIGLPLLSAGALGSR